MPPDPVDEALDQILGPTPTGATPSSTPKPSAYESPLASYTKAQLLNLWRAGRITEAEWRVELTQRNGGNPIAADDEIQVAKQESMSTAKGAAPGTLQPAAQLFQLG